ncbi:hypothetical protein HY636_04110 [Candidatus Woesearchaeota archaeon]|nr:hypothetical protein [Candidatus Woesearchaeota archaeon]
MSDITLCINIYVRHYNKPESIKHVKDEIRDYSTIVFDNSQLRNWRKEELKLIKESAIRYAKNKLVPYTDIKVTDSIIEEFVTDTMQDLMLFS